MVVHENLWVDASEVVGRAIAVLWAMSVRLGMVENKVCGALTTTRSPRTRLGAPLVTMAFSSARFLCFRVDRMKGVGKNIVVLGDNV